jgi:hypothetical protein
MSEFNFKKKDQLHIYMADSDRPGGFVLLCDVPDEQMFEQLRGPLQDRGRTLMLVRGELLAYVP